MALAKLLGMTGMLTVLIWASADSLVNETVSVSVSFELVPDAGASDMIIETPDARTRFELQISGPRRIVEDVQAQAPLHARLRVPDSPGGSVEMRLDRRMLKQQMIEQWDEFNKLTIVSVRPETMSVTVDHWVTKDVAVTLARPTLTYAVEPQLGRTSVVVRMRESSFNARPTGEPLQIDVTAEVERLLLEQPSGESVTVPVTLDRRSFGSGATLEPGTISVTATLEAKRSTATIATVPILIAVSFANLERPLRPVTQDGIPLSLVTQTVTITGPSDMVSRLVRGTTRIHGIIQLKQADLEGGSELKLRVPQYYLPPGVELAEDPPAIEFRLINVSAAGNEG